MIRKIVATDYDGTLNQNGISKRTLDKIKEFQAMGNLFGLVTGRTYENSFGIFHREQLFPFDFIISHNGAAACDRNGKTLFAHSVQGDIPWGSSTLVQELVARCLELTGAPCGVALEQVRYEFYPDNQVPDARRTAIPSPLSLLKTLHYFTSANALCLNSDMATKVTAQLKKEFGQFLNPIQNGRCIDITPAGIDKSTGIADYARIMDVSIHQIFTAGDNFNDLSMLRQYHGCAMNSGVDAAKEAAEYLCDEVADVIEIALR